MPDQVSLGLSRTKPFIGSFLSFPIYLSHPNMVTQGKFIKYKLLSSSEGQSSASSLGCFKSFILFVNDSQNYWTSIMCMIWDLFRSMNDPSPTEINWIRTFGWDPAICILISPPVDSDACWSFKTTSLSSTRTRTIGLELQMPQVRNIEAFNWPY